MSVKTFSELVPGDAFVIDGYFPAMSSKSVLLCITVRQYTSNTGHGCVQVTSLHNMKITKHYLTAMACVRVL